MAGGGTRVRARRRSGGGWGGNAPRGVIERRRERGRVADREDLPDADLGLRLLSAAQDFVSMVVFERSGERDDRGDFDRSAG